MSNEMVEAAAKRSAYVFLVKLCILHIWAVVTRFLDPEDGSQKATLVVVVLVVGVSSPRSRNP